MKSYKQSKLSLIAALLFIPLASLTAAPEKGSQAEIDQTTDWSFTPDPALPNVLILGDSISIGYTLQVRELLKGKANVFRPMGRNGNRRENCNGTGYGLENIDRWLAVQKWDVIHFNWGLHDLKHVKTAGSNDKSNDPNDPTQATLEEYTENMKILVATLEATGARLIFATTTPIAPGTLNPLRTPDAPAIYNAAALKLMAANKIRVNDLYAFCLPNLETWQLPRNCHFKPVGSEAIAKQVAAVIAEELPEQD
jgi:acyl-CoA thioesterase-1